MTIIVQRQRLVKQCDVPQLSRQLLLGIFAIHHYFKAFSDFDLTNANNLGRR